MKIKEIHWDDYLRGKFEQYKRGENVVVENYCNSGMDLEFICCRPLTLMRFLTLFPDYVECEYEEKPVRTHEQAMKEFESYLKRQRKR